MDSRSLQTVSEELRNGPTGAWLRAYFNKASLECASEAKNMRVEDMGTSFDRERLLAKSAHYEDLIDGLPRLVEQELKLQLEKENHE